MKKLSKLLLACVVLALLVACAMFSASAATDVRTTFVCPCSDCVAARKTDATYTCPAISSWKSLSSSGTTTFVDGGHYYVNTSGTYGQLSVPEGREVVLLVDNCTVTYTTTGTGRMISLVGSNNSSAKPMTLHVIGNNGGGLQVNKSATTEGPLCQVGGYDVGHLHLYGDLTLSSHSDAAAPGAGGLLRVPTNGRVYIHDNVGMGLTNDKDPYLKGQNTTGNGSVIYMQNGNASLYMEAGTLEGASSGKGGGALYMGGGSATICGSAKIIGCEATYGGAAYVSAGTFEISGNAQISGGEVSNYGGALYSNGTLTINGGTITGAAATKGGTAIATNGGTVTINGGTINGVGVDEDGNIATPNGGTIYLLSSAKTININGGIINGGSAELGGTIYQNGGTITLGNCTAYPSGATINGGTATDGGTVYMAAGTLNITKGSIYGGSATNGGAIYVASGATATVSGGSVNGSIAEKGGAFYLAEGANFSMTGGTVSGCAITNTTETAVRGGAFYLPVASTETMTFTGGTIQGGTIRRAANEETGITALSGYGGGIYMESGALTMAGTSMTGGYAYQGGAIYMVDGTLTMNGSTITGASASSYGGGIHTDAGAFIMTSGTITGCTSSSYGGSLYLDSTINMSGGTITAGEGSRGANIYANKTFTMSGGTISDGSGKRGGNMYLAGDFTMTGGTISGGTATEYAGGIFMAGNKTYNINGGTIENNTASGSTAPGGNLHIYNGDLKIEDTEGAVIIRGGTAANGGNISVSRASASDLATATINLTRADSVISGGTATNGAGIYVQGTLTLTAGTINGGKASTGGGCVYMASGTVNMNGGTLNAGTTTATKAKYGGCVYVETGTFNMNAGTMNGGTVTSGAAFYLTGSSSKMNMVNGTVNNGTVTTQGTLGYVASGATLNMTGGVMSSTASGENSGIRVQGSGKVYLHGDALIKAPAGGRNGIDLVGTGSTPATLLLAGNARVGDLDGNQTNVHNITFQSYDSKNEETGVVTTYYPRLRVANDWTGYASITDNFGNTGSGEYIMTVTSGDTTKYYAQCGTWDAETLTFTQGGIFASDNLIHGGADEGDLPVFGEEGLLMLPRAKAVTENGTLWFRLSDEAVDAACDGGYAVLYKEDVNPITIAAGKTAYVDFNGFNATVTGEGTLYGTDTSALATGTGTAVVTFDGIAIKPLAKSPATGDNFVAVKVDNTATFHAVTANITAVSIRPGTVGMYYTAKFVCDDTVKAYLDNFGLALSLSAMPDENFLQDKTVLYTQSAGSELGAGTYNSVIVQNIMTSAGTSNKTHGEMPIYANAYMKLTIDGEQVTIMATKTSDYSLKTLLQHVNTYWDTFADTAKDALATKIYDPYIRNFEGDDWKLYNIRTHANGGYSAEEEAILEERRQTVLDYMRESISLLWRSDKTMTYSLGNTERDQGKSFTIVEGRLYRGLPYVYAAGTQDSFLEYAAGEPDENGIYTITGLDATALNYESYGGRVGNDCSGAVTNAWSQVSTTVAASTSSGCSPYFGVIPVGNYLFNAPINPSNNRVLDTKVVVETNGQQTMFEAYAMLKPADAAYHQEYPSTKGNHIRMVVEVNVDRNPDGTINGANSYIIMLEQTRNLTTNNSTTKHPVTGETIYLIGGVNRKYTFNSLFNDHYIPVTVAELRDPTAVEETWVADSLEEPASIENLFTGNISSNRYTDAVKITIYNENGEVVQESISRKSRSYSKLFRMSQFVNEKPGSFKGQLDLEALEAGNYRCTVTLKLTIDDDYIHTVRDFTFSK